MRLASGVPSQSVESGTSKASSMVFEREAATSTGEIGIPERSSKNDQGIIESLSDRVRLKNMVDS